MCNFKLHLALELCLIVGAHAWGIKVMTHYSLFGIVMELNLSNLSRIFVVLFLVKIVVKVTITLDDSIYVITLKLKNVQFQATSCT